ncbi:MAG: glycerate kinase [Ignavibacteriales bacterium]|nr:MAG: glycerate kinase [Ignavibacteriales bacterium]
MRILFAPNAFKESLSARTISGILFNNFNALAPHHQYQQFPISDGGDGFIDVLAFHKGITKSRINAQLINGTFGDAEYLFDEQSGVLFTESASLIGLKLIPAPQRDVFTYDSRCLGAFIKRVCKVLEVSGKQVNKVVIGVGGTATIDLGLGASLVLAGHNLTKPILRTDSAEVAQLLKIKELGCPHIELVLDVKVAVMGQEDMVTEFGAQKGLKQEQTEMLRHQLNELVGSLEATTGKEYRSKAMGAGGGLAVGLDALHEISLSHSAEFVWEFLDLKSFLPNTDLVITTEGKLDRTSLLNKSVSVIESKCLEHRKPLIIICGSAEEEVKHYLTGRGTKIFELAGFFGGSIQESILHAELGLQKCVKAIYAGLK